MLGPVSDELMRLLLNFEAFTVPDDSRASEEAVTVDRGLHTQFHPDRPLNNYAVRIVNNPRAFVSNSEPSYRLTSSDMSIGINSKISVDCLLEDFKESPTVSQKSTTNDMYKTSDGKTSPVIDDPLSDPDWGNEFLSDLDNVNKIIEKQLGVDDSQKVQQVSSVKYDRWPLLTPGENTSESSTAKKMRYMSTELPAEMEVIEGSDEGVISSINHDHSYASVSATESRAIESALRSFQSRLI
ncbi:hypothetical protein [Endozoicomonas sp. ONNA2]|uniref:hypothetical protein n=1 Tax=Endozoicomonas sp. ONNA2 TaxID=2828741 RepID=UPI002147C089|nr:hypothetical protein [Endozoicomonas sp. ONNA2]